METEIADLQSHNVELESGSMHYVEVGTGQPLVLVHGYAPISSWRVWQANIEALASKRRVIAVDLPGYADSPEPAGGRPVDFGEWFGTYARTLDELITALELAPATLCGLSAGGGACLTLAAQWPSDVDRLILVDSAGSQAAERWKSIQMPALLTWQKEDRIVPVEEGRALAAAIPNARLEVFEGNAAGINPHDWHWSQALNPQKFNELVLDFLAN